MAGQRAFENSAKSACESLVFKVKLEHDLLPLVQLFDLARASGRGLVSKQKFLHPVPLGRHASRT